MVSETPDPVHSVPAATDIATDQVPLAHRWYCVPARQSHAPSSLQAPVWRPDTVEPEEDEDAEEDGETTVAAVADVACAAAALVASVVATTEAADAAVADEATAAGPVVMKTPPAAAALVAVEAAAVVAWLAAAVVPEEPEPATTAWHEPVGVARADEVAVPSFSTESPGFGNRRSVESCVPQPFPMLATNMSGRAS